MSEQTGQIYEIHTYMNDEGMLVKVHVPKLFSTAGSFGNLFSKSKIIEDGTGQKITGNIGIKTQQGIRPLEFTFPAEYNVQQAFEHFKEEAGKAYQEFMRLAKEEAEKHAKEKSNIIIPKSVHPNLGKVKQ